MATGAAPVTLPANIQIKVLEKIIATAGIGGASYTTTPTGTVHIIDLDAEGLSSTAKAVAVWWFPMDNMKDLDAFGTIRVDVDKSDPNNVVLTLSQQTAEKPQGVLRIGIAVAYTE